MRLVDEAALAECRARERCEWCGHKGKTDAAHIFSKGAGRVDIACNLVSLCRACHSLSHAGAEPNMDQLITLASRREGVRYEYVVNEVYRIRRLPKPISQLPKKRKRK